MKAIWAELLRADAQPDNWYAWIGNQSAHAALVGVPAALLCLSVGLTLLATVCAVAALYGVLWELLIQRGKDWRDSLMDTAMVAGGATVIAMASESVAAGLVAWLIYAALTAFGVWRRL